MAAYNVEKYIGEAIESILSQSYENWELLVCDDASKDNTYQVSRAYNDPRVTVYRNDENQKKPKTINELFLKSTGDLVTIHDADDISISTRFERMVEEMTKRPNLGMCGHTIERISNSGKPLKLYRQKVADYEGIVERMGKENTDGDPSMFIRRDVLVELGEVFRPYFQNNMDYDLGLRIIEKYESSNVLEVLSYYRNVPNSISKGVPHYKKLITQKITKELANQRNQDGLDALQKDDLVQIRQWETQFSEPYLKDATLHLREMASFFMYVRMNMEAIRYMFMAVRLEPKKFRNWHTLQYCLRKTLFRI